MTHTGPMPESDGEFTNDHKCETWDSSCGGYTDYKYTCLECSAVHWVDGSDS